MATAACRQRSQRGQRGRHGEEVRDDRPCSGWDEVVPFYNDPISFSEELSDNATLLDVWKDRGLWL